MTTESTSSNSNPNSKTKPLLSILTSSTAPLSLAIPPSDKKVNSVNKRAPKLSNVKKSYIQASKANILPNVEDVLQIKEVFPTLVANKVVKMIRAKNSSKRQKKPRITITTKGPLKKQIITPIAKSNAELIINSAN